MKRVKILNEGEGDGWGQIWREETPRETLMREMKLHGGEKNLEGTELWANIVDRMV